jgi:hypothetical protein
MVSRKRVVTPLNRFLLFLAIILGSFAVIVWMANR